MQGKSSGEEPKMVMTELRRVMVPRLWAFSLHWEVVREDTRFLGMFCVAKGERELPT